MAICLPGMASRVKAGCHLSDTLGTVGDHHDLDDDQDDEHDETDDEVAADDDMGERPG